MQLKQLVPQEFCLRCDVCCRFPQADSVWAPLFTKSEVKHLVENDILPPLVFTTHPDQEQGVKEINPLKINLIAHEDYYICPCLEPREHKCKIYEQRPFECQLYPFLLVKSHGKFYLAKDIKCPYFKSGPEDKTKIYIEYLKKELQTQKMLYFLNANLDLFTKYPVEDLELLFPIHL